jgi:acyl carrier protein
MTKASEELMEVDTIREQLRQFIVKTFPLARKRRVGVDNALLEEGIIDSLGVLELVRYIETEFRVEVSDEDLFPENFHTIGALASFVERKLMTDGFGNHDGNGTSGRS